VRLFFLRRTLSTLLKAVVFWSNEKTGIVGDLLAIARNCAKRRENSQNNPPILALIQVSQIGPFCYVAVYDGDSKEGVQKPKASGHRGAATKQ
jgi:hypothetical protein